MREARASHSLYVAGWPLDMSGERIIEMLEEYGHIQILEFTRRSRGYIPRAWGRPERRALYVHYMDTTSVDLAGESYRRGGLSEKRLVRAGMPGEYATLYVRPVRPNLLEDLIPVVRYEPLLSIYRNEPWRWVYGWDRERGFWDDWQADWEAAERALRYRQGLSVVPVRDDTRESTGTDEVPGIC